MIQELKDGPMKVNYSQRIETPASELKIIIRQQRTITNRQKVQALYFLKSGSCQSITDVSERLGVHRTTVQRWLKQYNEGGNNELLIIRYSPGRPRAIPFVIAAELSTKISEESWEFKSYKEIGEWGESHYKISIKYSTLHKYLRYRLKRQLKVPRRSSNKKVQLLRNRVLKKIVKLLKISLWLESTTSNPAKQGLKYWCQAQTRIGLKTIERKKNYRFWSQTNR